MKWLLDEVLAKDIRVVEANKVKGGQKQERRKFVGVTRFDGHLGGAVRMGVLV
jgi:hypothetical protein